MLPGRVGVGGVLVGGGGVVFVEFLRVQRLREGIHGAVHELGVYEHVAGGLAQHGCPVFVFILDRLMGVFDVSLVVEPCVCSLAKLRLQIWGAVEHGLVAQGGFVGDLQILVVQVVREVLLWGWHDLEIARLLLVDI